MSCPRCGELVPSGAPACTRCGAPLGIPASAATMKAVPLGGARPGHGEVDDIASTLVWQKGAPAPPQLGPSATAMLGATEVGMPPGFEEAMRAAHPAAAPPPAAPSPAAPSPAAPSPAAPSPAAPSPAAPSPAAPPPAAPRPPPADPAARTLLGVGRPGGKVQPASATESGGSSTLPARVIGSVDAAPASGPVPARPASGGSAAASPAPRTGRPQSELGATLTPALGARQLPGVREAHAPRKKNALDKRLVVAAPGKKPPPANRTAVIAIAGGALALVAVLVVLLLPRRPALVAHPRVDAEGRDGLDFECAGCPDSTTIRVGAATAAMVSHRAFLPIALPLGESKLEVAIRRPGSATDELTSVGVHLPYRVTTDLSSLRGERPAIQVVVIAQDGTLVNLDGRDVPLVSGRAIQLLDVTGSCAGESEEARTLSRQIPYVITPPGGSAEQGTLHVSVPITSLRIAAPGPAVVIDNESFTLAGRTTKGAELFAGPHAIPVSGDGTFSHAMNVSAIGATQIAVRAQGQGMAPRIVKIDVRRVASLEAAAREFSAKAPLGLADLTASAKEKVGREAMVSGLVLEARSADSLTVLSLRGFGGPACPPLPQGTKPDAAGRPGPCAVQIAIGAKVSVGPGDVITGCGRYAGMAGDAGAEAPQVRADFLVKGTP